MPGKVGLEDGGSKRSVNTEVLGWWVESLRGGCFQPPGDGCRGADRRAQGHVRVTEKTSLLQPHHVDSLFRGLGLILCDARLIR